VDWHCFAQIYDAKAASLSNKKIWFFSRLVVESLIDFQRKVT
jgi:hypothetical protein